MIKNTQSKYTLDPKSTAARIAMICLLLSVIVRAVGALVNRTVFADRFTLAEFLLPIVCALVYILCIAAFGRKGFWISIVPFVFGVMAFVLRLFSYDNLPQEEVSRLRILASIFFYLVLTVLYTAVVLGGVRVKWLLVLSMLVPFAAHGWLDIYPVFAEGRGADRFAVLMEISVLLIFLGMFFAALGLSRKRKVTEVKPESGKTVVPPIPGNKLDGKPPVISDAAEEPAAEESVEERQEENEAPEPAEEESAPEQEDKPAEEPEPAEEKPAEAPVTDNAEQKETEEYDPFAPSQGPIRLTLKPEGFVSSDETSGGDSEL